MGPCVLSDPRPPGIAVARRRQRPPRAAVLLSLRLGGASQSCLSSPGCREPRLASPLTANVRFCLSITSELNSEIKRITSITKLDALRERLWVTLLPWLTRNFALTLCPKLPNPWRPGERTSSSQRTTQAIAARHLRPLELTYSENGPAPRMHFVYAPTVPLQRPMLTQLPLEHAYDRKYPSAPRRRFEIGRGGSPAFMRSMVIPKHVGTLAHSQESRGRSSSAW